MSVQSLVSNRALLASRAVIEALSDDLGATCPGLLDEITEQAESPLPAQLGTLHLFAEACRKLHTRTPSAPGGCVERARTLLRAEIPPVVRLAALYHEVCVSGLREMPLDSNCSLPQLETTDLSSDALSEFFERLATVSEDWRKVIKGVRPVELRQGFVMHLLEVLLPVYEAEQLPAARARLNAYLVPLLRALFMAPDLAHVVYSRYFYGAEKAHGPFHRLYTDDISRIEKFKSVTAKRRTEILGTALSETESADQELAHELNFILHGIRAANPLDLSEKSTLVCQMSQLVLKDETPQTLADQSQGGKFVSYAAHLDRIRPCRPGTSGWELVPDAVVAAFKEGVLKAYADGYDPELLGRLFEGDSTERPYPVWFSDGEVAFHFLLKEVASGRDSDGILESLMLFAQDKPTERAWSLVSFLERALYGRPQWYRKSATVSGPPHIVYRHLAPGLTRENFKAACAALANAGPLDPATLGRLKSFELEAPLRENRSETYTLFFLPLSRVGNVPDAFLAGTLANLETPSLPFVSHRSDYHLFAVLDAIRPIIDRYFGVVLRNRQARVVEEARAKVDAQTRAKTARAVLPAVERLSRIFREAQGSVFQIEAAVDEDWSGLFGTSMQDQVGRFFKTGHTIHLSGSWEEGLVRESGKDPVPGKGEVFSCDHDVVNEPRSKKHLYSILLYLARNECGYDGPSLGSLLECTNFSQRSFSDHGVVFKAPMDIFNGLFLAAFVNFSAPDADSRILSSDALQLLKLLSVDSGDSAKGVHMAQIAAALDLVSQPLRKAKPFDSQNPECLVNGVSLNIPAHAHFNPRERMGWLGLDKMLTSVRDSSKGDLRTSGTAPLSPGVSPARFLRAVRILVSDSLGQGAGKKGVEFETWKLELDTTAGTILVSLVCNNLFKSETKQSMYDYYSSTSAEYHGLRTGFRDVCEAVGAFPMFTTALRGEHEKKNRFVVREKVDEGRCIFEILIGEPESAPKA